MPKLFVIAALMFGGIAVSPATTLDNPRASAASQPVAQTAADQHLDTQKRVWFGEAVGHILDGDSSDARTR